MKDMGCETYTDGWHEILESNGGQCFGQSIRADYFM